MVYCLLPTSSFKSLLAGFRSSFAASARPASSSSFTLRHAQQHELAVTSFIPRIFCERSDADICGPRMWCSSSLASTWILYFRLLPGVSPFCREPLFRVQSEEGWNLLPPSPTLQPAVPLVGLPISTRLGQVRHLVAVHHVAAVWAVQLSFWLQVPFFTSAPSNLSRFIFVSHSIATLALRFLEKRNRSAVSTNSQSESDKTTSQIAFTCERERVSNKRKRSRGAHTHPTPLLTLIPLQMHHFLLQIHARVNFITSAFTNSHSFLFLPQTHSSHFCPLLLWLPRLLSLFLLLCRLCTCS